MVERIDITGQRYGRLVAVERSASPLGKTRRGIPYARLLSRLKSGWKIDDALTPDPREKPVQRNNKSGHTGVCFDKSRGMWMAYTHHKGKFINLGLYASKESAVEARADAKKRGPKPPEDHAERSLL